MQKIDKKFFKTFCSQPTQFELEYIPFYSKEQKEAYIKNFREKKRNIERLESITSSYFA